MMIKDNIGSRNVDTDSIVARKTGFDDFCNSVNAVKTRRGHDRND